MVSGIVGLIRESGSSAVDLADADTIGSALTKAATAAQTSGVAIDPTASSFTDTVTGMKTQIASANTAVKTALTDHAGDPEAALEQIAKVEKVAQDSLAAKARAVADQTDDRLTGLLSTSTAQSPAQQYRTWPDPNLRHHPRVRAESGVISVYSDAYTDISTNWAVSAGAITDTEIVIREQATPRRRSPVRTASPLPCQAHSTRQHEFVARQRLALETER